MKMCILFTYEKWAYQPYWSLKGYASCICFFVSLSLTFKDTASQARNKNEI